MALLVVHFIHEATFVVFTYAVSKGRTPLYVETAVIYWIMSKFCHIEVKKAVNNYRCHILSKNYEYEKLATNATPRRIFNVVS